MSEKPPCTITIQGTCDGRHWVDIDGRPPIERLEDDRAAAEYRLSEFQRLMRDRLNDLRRQFEDQGSAWHLSKLEQMFPDAFDPRWSGTPGKRPVLVTKQAIMALREHQRLLAQGQWTVNAQGIAVEALARDLADVLEEG